MRKHLEKMALVCACATAAIIAGCGEGGLSGNAVAEVDGTPIERSDFDHWLTIAAKSSGQPNAAVPKPPEFTDCIAQAKKAATKPAEGQPKQTDADYKKLVIDLLTNQIAGFYDPVERHLYIAGWQKENPKAKLGSFGPRMIPARR